MITERRITASQLYSYLTCPHRVAMDAFADPATRDPVSPFVELLWKRGTLYEREVVAAIGAPFVDLSALKGDAKEAATREAIARGEPLIYAGRLTVDNLVGEPDLLRHEAAGYAAIDIKSGAGEEGGDEDAGEDGKPKKTYGVQIALYTDLLERLGVSAGRYGYIWDIHGDEIRYDLDIPLGKLSPTLAEIYQATRAEVGATLDRSRTTFPAAATVCKQCVWRSACFKVLKATNDLTLLPGLGRANRDALADAFPKVRDLASADVELLIRGEKTPFRRIGAKTLRRFKARAVLATTKDPKPYLKRSFDWPVAPVELFFDIETDPMRDLCYLHGFVIREDGDTATERFEGIFASAPTAAAEKEAFEKAMAIFRRYPNAVVIHYSKYERTEFRKLARKYPDVCTVEEVEALYTPPQALDLLYDVVWSGSEWPTMDYSVKSLAKFCGFQWRDEDPSGASSIEWFDRWATTGDPALRVRLLKYNEDDCVAMRVVLDVLKALEVRTAP